MINIEEIQQRDSNMKYVELLENNEEQDDFEQFLADVKNNCDKEILKFLFEKPLFRGSSNYPVSFYEPYNSKEFGREKYPVGRIPKDNPFFIDELMNDFLKKQGFEARRDNSIFVTSDMKFAGKFATSEFDLYVIFPEKNFSFTWNPYINDFYYDSFLDIIGENSKNLFELDTEKLFSENRFVNVFVKSLQHIVDSRSSINEKSKDIKSKLSRIEKLNDSKKRKKLALEIFLEDLKMDPMYLFTIFMENYDESELQNYITFNENSRVAKKFLDENFEAAVLSGNEIMITNKSYFYIQYSFFKENRPFIEEFLNI